MAAGPVNSPRMKDAYSKKPSRQGFWPDPKTEAFRRPVRFLQEDHLHISRETDPISVSIFLEKGYKVYFSYNEDVVRNQDFTVPECTYYAHNNKFNCLNYVNNDNFVNDDNINKNISDKNNNDIIDDVRMWSNKVPECTPYSFNSHKNVNKKYTYSGYLCSFINPP